MAEQDILLHEALLFHDTNINTVEEILQPLKDLFYIDSFFYIELFVDLGKIFILSTEKNAARNLMSQFKRFSNEFYLALSACDLSVPNIFVWPAQTTDSVGLMMKEEGLSNGFTIIKKKEHSVQKYGFVSKRNEIDLSQVYLKNKSLFEHFIDYFKYRTNHLLAARWNHLTDFIIPKSINIVQNLTPSFQEISNFLKKTPIRKYYVKEGGNTYLTPRELECLRYLYEGMCPKEIAKSLEISNRTVEVFISSIKNKVDLFHKSDLIKFYKESNLN